MNLASIDQLQGDDEMLEPFGEDIWVMDDHRWAFYVWQRFSFWFSDRWAFLPGGRPRLRGVPSA